MKYLDLLVLFAAIIIFFILNQTGYENLAGRYCVVVFTVAFYAGKMVSKLQTKKAS